MKSVWFLFWFCLGVISMMAACVNRSTRQQHVTVILDEISSLDCPVYLVTVYDNKGNSYEPNDSDCNVATIDIAEGNTFSYMTIERNSAHSNMDTATVIIEE